MSEQQKRRLAREAIRTYAPVAVGSEAEAEQVREAIDERGFLGATFEADGTWYAQAV